MQTYCSPSSLLSVPTHQDFKLVVLELKDLQKIALLNLFIISGRVYQWPDYIFLFSLWQNTMQQTHNNIFNLMHLPHEEDMPEILLIINGICDILLHPHLSAGNLICTTYQQLSINTKPCHQIWWLLYWEPDWPVPEYFKAASGLDRVFTTELTKLSVLRDSLLMYPGQLIGLNC